VRNLSHKDLPFEKRNVQIFMHGTILGKENQEEAADLYVYRTAELKAVQIGRVTRLLKETSVDCIINHDQTNFTQEIMMQNIEGEITQELSNKTVMHDFRIGDSPFSPSCDYMASCNYSCRPDKKIDNINEDTYNEAFIFMNSDKITQKIKMLMKEGFFYDKKTLMQRIQTPKKYPYSQIYAVLSQLIDENEPIIDKYGRSGTLVNIGEYYLFQPVELTDPNISVFERSVPLNYKHEMIRIDMNKKLLKPKEYEQSDENMETEVSLRTKGLKVKNELETNYKLAIEFTKGKIVPRGDENWFKHCGAAMIKLTKDYPDIKKYLLDFVVAHMIEQLLFEDKVELLRYVYSVSNDPFITKIKQYFEKNIIMTKGKDVIGIIFYELNKRKIMVFKRNDWIEATPLEGEDIDKSERMLQLYSLTKKEFNNMIGFIGYEKSNKYLVFKTKNMDAKRNTGARCDEAGKIKTIESLNKIIGEERYTKENTKLIKEGDIISYPINQIELCIIKEFILRYFNEIKQNGKIWFLTPEMTMLLRLDESK
jgi:hypothetical protein